jgi:GDP/UDP-N,N'-diacetylbacillosamine 2-epimerase (hydrolysing)
MKKKIIFFSGKRGGINHLIPIFDKLKDKNYYELKFIFSDMHLSKRFGNTVTEYLSLKKKIIKNKSLIDNDSEFSRAMSISLGMKNNVKIIKNQKPDLVIILGDRSELFSISVPCMINNVPLLHLYGGDKTQGCTDESTRHATSMLSNYHIVSNDLSRKNLIKFGIDPKRILNSGLLSLHSFKIDKIQNKKKFFENNKLDQNKKMIISIIHPETWNSKSFKKNIKNYFKIFNKLNHNLILIYPCGDPGYQLIIDEIKKFKNKINIKIFKNIKSDEFYNFLYYSDILIGNSSSGILEAGYFNTDVINVGNRQKNRYSKNVENVNFNGNKILKKINHLLLSKKRSLKKFNKKHIYFQENGLINSEKFINKILKKNNHNQILKLF